MSSRAPRKERDRGLVRMFGVSFALHAALIVLLVATPWRTADVRPPLVSYSVDLVPSDRLGGKPAPGPAAKAPPPGSSVHAPPKADRPPQPPPAPRPKAEDAAKLPPPPKPEPPKPKPEPPKPKVEPKPVPPKPKPDPPKPADPPKPKVEPKPAPPKPKVEPPKPAPKAPIAPPKPPEAPKPKPAPEPQPQAQPQAQPQPKAPEPPKPAPERQAEKPQAEPVPPAEPAPEPEPDPEQARRDVAQKLRDEQLAAAVERMANRTAPAHTDPSGSGLGGAGDGGMVQGFEFLLYKGVVENLVRQSWAWSGRNRTLSAVVGFGIEPDGRVVDVAIVRPSGDPSYDSMARRAVERASPLPPPPAAHREEFSRYELELRADGGS